MGRVAKPARAEIARIRREQIVEAAVAIISEQGLQNLSLSAIEQRADMSRGQLTYYFPAKEDILLAMFDRLLMLLKERVQTSSGEGHPCVGNDRGWERVRRVLTLVLTQKPAHPEFGALQYTFLAQASHRDDFRQRLANLYEAWRSSVASDLAEELTGRAGVTASPRALATFIQAILHGLFIQNAADPEVFDWQEMLALCLDILETYLHVPRRAEKPPSANGSRPRRRARRSVDPSGGSHE
jgi:AcrR family transcriptional regulator